MSIDGCNKPRRQYFVYFFFLLWFRVSFFFLVFITATACASCSFSNEKTTVSDESTYKNIRPREKIINNNNNNKWICSENQSWWCARKHERNDYNTAQALEILNDSLFLPGPENGCTAHRAKALTTLT